MGFRLSMMGIVLIILCLLGTGTQFFAVAVDELSAEQIVLVANETNNADISQGESGHLFLLKLF